VIDLHLHTTASDGRSTPEALVREAADAGVTTMAVTDHDTVAAVPAVRAAARAAGLEFVAGIEITAVHGARDVHMLGYFFGADALDRGADELSSFLVEQRADRRRRLVEMIDRLTSLGVPIATDFMDGEEGGRSHRSLGRPLLAQALVDAGHVRNLRQAFDEYLADGGAAFVPRRGASPGEVAGLIARAGGLASFAHPGRLGLDGLVPTLVEAGLGGLEVFHPDHDDEDVERYRAMAAEYGLVATGGSDYHGPDTARAAALGRVGLPADEFARLIARAGATPSRL